MLNESKKYKIAPNISKLNNGLLNNLWIKEQIIKELRKYWGLNYDVNTPFVGSS